MEYRVGIIGCGNIFPMHALSLSKIDDVKIVAVCDIDEKKAKREAEDYKCNYYTDYKEMIEKEKLDAVHILTPHYLHPIMSIYALEKGVNVLCEKPMSIKLDDAILMVETAKKKNKTLGVIFQNRYNPSSKTVKEYLENNKLGKIYSMRLILSWFRSQEYYLNSSWRGTWEKEGGGVIINQAIHSFDLLRWFANSDIESICANIYNRMHEKIEVEDTAEGMIKFKSGCIANFWVTNNNTYNAPVEIDMHCENGFVKITADKATICLNSGEVITAQPNEEEIKMYGKNAKSYWGVSHYKQIKNYYESLKNGQKPFIDGEDALKTQEMICSIYNSAKSNKKVYLTF